jgi:hypothetical protein
MDQPTARDSCSIRTRGVLRGNSGRDELRTALDLGTVKTLGKDRYNEVSTYQACAQGWPTP